MVRSIHAEDLHCGVAVLAIVHCCSSDDAVIRIGYDHAWDREME